MMAIESTQTIVRMVVRQLGVAMISKALARAAMTVKETALSSPTAMIVV